MGRSSIGDVVKEAATMLAAAATREDADAISEVEETAMEEEEEAPR